MTARSERPAADPDAGTGRTTVEALFGALEDSDCRRILRVTGQEPMTAQEIADACDIPTSTVYRKLDRLTGAGLLETQTRFRTDGKHPQGFTRGVEAVRVAFGDRRIDVEVDRGSEPD